MTIGAAIVGYGFIIYFLLKLYITAKFCKAMVTIAKNDLEHKTFQRAAYVS
jgi:hypothetical protein